MNGKAWLAVCGTVAVLTSTAAAVNIETAQVSNPGNAGELSGAGGGGSGPDCVVGSVGYVYEIGKFEVTAGQYTEFLNAVARTDAYGLYDTNMGYGYGCMIARNGSPGNYTYSVASGRANRPVNCVSWGDAARFANWLANGQPRTGVQDLTTTEDGSYYLNGATTATRKPNATWVLPSEHEWYKAAYHKNDGVTGNYFDYPTSSDSRPNQDMADVSGNNANLWTFPYTYPIDSGTYYATVVGEFQNSESPYGTFDQGGNIQEWTEAVLPDSKRLVRGGSFNDHIGYEAYLHSATRSFGMDPSRGDGITGFRLALVPEPATLVLLAFGGLVLARRRRNR